MWKHIFIIGFILTVVGGYVFWTSSRDQNIQQDISQQTLQHKIRESVSDETVELPNENKIELADKVEQLMSEVFEDDILTEEQDSTPDALKMFLLMETPAYASFLETDPTSLSAFYDFFAAHGVALDKNKLFEDAENRFKKHFPGESAEEVEPRMRQALADLYAESGGNPYVLVDFVSNEEYAAWGTHYFRTDSKAFIGWGGDIIRNYELPSTEGAVLTEQGEPSDELPTKAASETLQLPQDDDVPIGDNGDIDALANRELPREPSFAKMLRGAFPPQRVNAAMRTLNRYEAPDALRRLRQSDPEIATYIERFVRRSKEEDK